MVYPALALFMKWYDTAQIAIFRLWVSVTLKNFIREITKKTWADGAFNHFRSIPVFKQLLGLHASVSSPFYQCSYGPDSLKQNGEKYRFVSPVVSEMQ